MLKRAIVLAADLLIVGTLSGCGHLLGDGRVTDAIVVAGVGTAIVLLLTAAGLLAEHLWDKYGK